MSISEFNKGLFVTGTDTGIGKTLVSAILLSAFRTSRNVGYWKPIQTGIEQDNDTEMVRDLARCSRDEIHESGIRLERPLSPHLSARISGQEFDIEKTLAYRPKLNQDRYWIVEGAGGVLVPLNRNEMMIDFMSAISLPAVVVSRSGLGTINHTLLTLESLRSRGVSVYGVVLSGARNSENRDAIEHYGKTRVLFEIPVLDQIDCDVVEKMAFGIDIGE